MRRTKTRKRIAKSTAGRGGAVGFEGLDVELVASATGRDGKAYLLLDPPVTPWVYPRTQH